MSNSSGSTRNLPLTGSPGCGETTVLERVVERLEGLLAGFLTIELREHGQRVGEARDAALTSIEIMLDEEDYDGDDHRDEPESMLSLLEAARSFEDLEGQSDYHRLLERLVSAVPAPA
jgi:NTPase